MKKGGKILIGWRRKSEKIKTKKDFFSGSHIPRPINRNQISVIQHLDHIDLIRIRCQFVMVSLIRKGIQSKKKLRFKIKKLSYGSICWHTVHRLKWIVPTHETIMNIVRVLCIFYFCSIKFFLCLLLTQSKMVDIFVFDKWVDAYGLFFSHINCRYNVSNRF